MVARCSSTPWLSGPVACDLNSVIIQYISGEKSVTLRVNGVRICQHEPRLCVTNLSSYRGKPGVKLRVKFLILPSD